MKKFISGILALGLLSIANAEESGFYVGANVGLPIASINYGNIPVSDFILPVLGGVNGVLGALSGAELSDLAPSSGFGYTIGLETGYKMMFNEQFGVRGYVDYYFGQAFGSKDLMGNKIEVTQLQHLVALNADAIYAPIDLISIYLGIGVGFQGFSNDIKAGNLKGEFVGSFALPINVGVNFNFGASTVSLGAKIPILSGDLIQNTKANVRNYIIKLGYSYTF